MANKSEREREALELRLDAYLDGQLSPAETRETERMLVDPDVAAALAEALALREIMTMAAEAPPEGLADRIIEALGVEAPPAEPYPRDARGARLARTRNALYGASWMMRPAGGVARPGRRAALAGASMVGRALRIGRRR